MPLSSPSGRRGESERDSTPPAFLVALSLALATMTGAALSAAGTGVLQRAAQAMGFGLGTQLQAEQRHQADAIAKIEDDIQQLDGTVAALTSRASDKTADTIIDDRLSRLESDLAEMKTDVAWTHHQEPELVPAQSWLQSLDGLKTSLAHADLELGALRSTIDDHDQMQRRAIADVTKRVDRIEHLLAAGEVTSSIGPAPPRQPPRRVLADWSVREVANGGAVVAGHGTSFQVTPGKVVPGLGRILRVRQRATGWIVVTDNGIVVQR